MTPTFSYVTINYFNPLHAYGSRQKTSRGLTRKANRNEFAVFIIEANLWKMYHLEKRDDFNFLNPTERYVGMYTQ